MKKTCGKRLKKFERKKNYVKKKKFGVLLKGLGIKEKIEENINETEIDQEKEKEENYIMKYIMIININ